MASSSIRNANTTTRNIAVIGSSGAIGSALVRQLVKHYPNACVHAISDKYSVEQAHGNQGIDTITVHAIDYDDEASIAAVASRVCSNGPLHCVIVATGMLHDNQVQPEKSLKDLSMEKFQRLFQVNTIVPALLAKHFIPMLHRSERSLFTVLSARVGSISDNRLGGWYAYRSSKAALNMIVKTAAIETSRRNKNAIIVGLHPGTVDSQLSKPFQANVPQGKLFTPEYSAQCLLKVMDNLAVEDSGNCYAWDGQRIEP